MMLIVISIGAATLVWLWRREGKGILVGVEEVVHKQRGCLSSSTQPEECQIIRVVMIMDGFELGTYSIKQRKRAMNACMAESGTVCVCLLGVVWISEEEEEEVVVADKDVDSANIVFLSSLKSD